MIVIVFRSRLRPEATETGYPDMAAEMYASAQGMPGFISFKSYTAADGERLALVHWQDAETLAGWRNHDRHRLAQSQGRQQWYEWYSIEVAEVTRSREFNASPTGTEPTAPLLPAASSPSRG
jgi:heme-degrading monooxygenase HmoA